MNRKGMRMYFSSSAVRWLWASVAAGCLGLALGGMLQPERLWPNLLLLGFLCVGFALGGLLLIAFHDLTGARWSDGFRCVRESLAGALPWVAAALAAILILGIPMYPWSQPNAFVEETAWFQRWWFQRGFFAARAITYLAIWVALGVGMVRASRRDAIRGGATSTSVRRSATFLVIFSVTFWLASTDWIMSLEPRWYSTAFAVYNFGGVILSSLAVVILVTVSLRRSGPLQLTVTRADLRDLGTLLLSFSCFWMYIWFCQYMLIWYTNIPEETSHYAVRMHGLWTPLFYANVVINWAIPFAVLLPRAAKESAGVLVKVSLLLLVGRWLDMYLMILPSTGEGDPVIGFCEIGALALTVGTLGLLLTQALRKSPQLSSVAVESRSAVDVVNSRVKHHPGVSVE